MRDIEFLDNWFIVLHKDSLQYKFGTELTKEDFDTGIVCGPFSKKEKAEKFEDKCYIDPSILEEE